VQKEMQRWSETPERKPTGEEELPPAIWKQHRLAYGVAPENIEKRDRRRRLERLMHFSLDFALMWDRTEGGWRPIGSRWENLQILLQDPPVFSFDDADGVPQHLVLNPKDRVTVSQQAARRLHFETLENRIRTIVQRERKDGLLHMYKEQIYPRLMDQRTTDEVQEITERYFGKSAEDGRHIPGLIDSMLEQPKTLGAV